MGEALRTLVVCYSLEGSTLQVAKALAQAAAGEVLQIKPKKEIPSKGFGKFLTGGMQAIFRQTPELMPWAIDLHNYHVVIIGSPTWGGHLSSPMRSWLKQTKLQGKRVALYSTCQGNVGKSLLDMRALLPGGQVIGEHTFIIKQGQQTATEDEAKQWYLQITRN